LPVIANAVTFVMF